MGRASGVKKRYRRLRRLAFLGAIGTAAYAWRQKQLAENERRYGTGAGSSGPGG